MMLGSINLRLADGSLLQNLQVVRTIPDKRVVCRAQWQGQSVFAKIFIGKDAQKYAKRDVDGITKMVDEHILTPKLLHVGSGAMEDRSDVQVIVLEEIKNAKTADELWPALKLKARFELANQLVNTLAEHHLSDIVQTDIHLKNFLVAENKIYTLDGDGVRQFADLLVQRARKNLAELISKFDVLEQEAWLPKLLETYNEACAWHLPITIEQIAPLANQHRLKVTCHYADKKVFRNCTDVSVGVAKGQYPCGFQAWSNAFDLPKNLDLDALLESGARLKSGNTCTVGLSEINGVQVAIKRYNIKGLAHALGRGLRPSRAAISWANAHRLKLLGIATAAPIALLEARKFRFIRGKAYFLSQFVDAPDVTEFFAQTRDKKARAEAVKSICELFYKLYLLQISHGDMKATNIKMADNEPVLIDLDSMRQHSTYFRSSVAHLRDLHRFMQNWENDIPLYNAFVKTFKVVYPDVSILVKAGVFVNKELTE